MSASQFSERRAGATSARIGPARKPGTARLYSTQHRTSVDSALGPNGFWEVPAAWRAVVQDGKIAEWRVYADNQPLRKLMGDATP